MKNLALIAMVSSLSMPVLAEGFYVLGSVGQASVDGMEALYSGAQQTAPGFSSDQKNKSTAYKLQAGHQFSPYFALEGGYVNFGKASSRFSLPGIRKDAAYQAEGFNLVGVGIVPLNNQWSLFGKLGGVIARVKVNDTMVNVGQQKNQSASSTDLRATWGVGANWDVTRNVALRAEYEQFHKLGGGETGKATVDMASLGVAYKF